MAFPTLADGVAHYLKFLKGGRYNSCWKFIEAGQPANFVSSIKKLGYFTAPEADYIKLMNVFYNRYMKATYYEDALKANEKISPWKKLGEIFNKFFG